MTSTTNSGTASSAQLSCTHCEREVFARGLCGAHYHRWYRHGDPLKGGTPHGAVRAWLDAAVLVETDECLLFPFAIHGGHGVVHIGKTTQQAHRYVLAKATGENPPELEAAHNCRNASCCNKRHLRWDTHAGNMADMIRHGTSTRGARNSQTKLTEEQVRAIRAAEGTKLQREIAADHGVSLAAVNGILRGRRWEWLV